MLVATEDDLVAGAVALAYRYVDLAALRDALVAREKANGNGGRDLVDVLAENGKLTAPRAEKLKRATALVRRLKADAVYGTIALRNRLVGASMMNAVMEETRKQGFVKTLSQTLLERGVVTPEIDRAIEERRKVALEKVESPETSIAQAIDLAKDDAATIDRKLAILLGEVAAKVSFLTKDELESALRAEERVRQGLPVEEEAETVRGPAAAPAPAPAPAPPVAPAGTQPATSEEDEPIKGYELLLRLGQGAMGAVLKARKKDTGEIVALKILKPELARDEEFVRRFYREAMAVQRLNHPNIIRAIQVGKSGEYHFFAMEFVDGDTAAGIVKQKGKIPERLALSVVRQVAGALDHAWANQIIHRDIKPDNIMITKDGVAKLTDLGLARTVRQESTLTITGVVMGSPAYISPEQATGEKNLDTRSDIYALGASLYHMLVGVVPYDGDSPLQVMLKHMNEAIPDARKKDPSIHQGTQWLIAKMMAKRPEGRFQSPKELEAAVQKVEQAIATGARGAPTPGGAPARKPAARSTAMSSEGARQAVGPKSQVQPAAPKKAEAGAAAEEEQRKSSLERLRKIGRKKR